MQGAKATIDNVPFREAGKKRFMERIVRIAFASDKAAREKGMILAIATLVVLIMVLMTMPFLAKLSSQQRSTQRSFKALASLNLAEAGAEQAVYELNQKYLLSDWSHDGDNLLLNIPRLRATEGGTVGGIDVTVFPVVDETRILESTGKSPFVGNQTVDRKVRLGLEAYYKSLFEFAIFTEIGMHLRSGAIVDSYDSRDGPYDWRTRGDMGHCGTNSYKASPTDIYGMGVELASNANIYGAVASGSGTRSEYIDEWIDTGAANIEITGGKHVLDHPFDMPAVDIYELSLLEGDPFGVQNWFEGDAISPAVYKGSLHAASRRDAVILTPENSGIYHSLTIDTGTTVKISGDVTLFIDDPNGGEFQMMSNTAIEILPDSSLNLILGNVTYLQRSNTFENLTQNAANLKILGTDDFTSTLELDSNTGFFGLVYTPKADIHYDSNVDITGSIVCNYLGFDSEANVHYDEALGDLNILKGGIPYYRVINWQEVFIE